jgi:RimJ/RimL family protein N-acetyltransferase
MNVPILSTPRLTLRGHHVDDLADCAAMWADPRVTQHIGGRPFTREEVWSKVLRYVGHWALLGFGYWVVVEKASGRFAGEVGFADFHREMEPSLDGAPEAGWVLSPSSHGKGFATEALRAALGWLEASRSSKRSVCIIDPGNAASFRVADKCGFVEIARTTYKGGPTVLLERA